MATAFENISSSIEEDDRVGRSRVETTDDEEFWLDYRSDWVEPIVALHVDPI